MDLSHNKYTERGSLPIDSFSDTVQEASEFDAPHYKV